ncbi:pilus assembly protein TadG-related protein [Mesorhizobium sp. 1M-11]|uniref:pilus assembly protein TadG-related protein n=1 Tax=Mesorhizobium sp. 1M-11 TaxID=1529006 RepID=UPI001FCD27C9|nr:pilus assembly protein TadG-related protein [Mesorhizobium sp. 1M-11]
MRILSSLIAVSRRFLPDRSANFAVMTALCTPVALALMAVAIDEGSLYTERRETQSITDLAAIAAGSNIAKAEQAVLNTLNDNGLTGSTVGTGAPTPGKPVANVVRGRYTPTAAVGQRFQAGEQPYNAVSVSVRRIGTMYFGTAFMSAPTIGTTAIASTTPQAAFSIGSRLASVDTSKSPLLNTLLGKLLGTNVALNAMDYNSLLAADVNVLSFLDQLAIKLNLTGVSYSDVLSTKVTIGQILGALASVPGLDSRSQLALKTLAAGATNSIEIPLKTLVDLGNVGRLGVGQRPAGLTVDAGVFDLISAAAELANGGKQIDLATLVNIPNVLSISVLLAVGEPPQSSPWFRVGQKGSVVRTAQTRLKLVVKLLPPSNEIDTGVTLVGSSKSVITLPVHVELAYAEATLTDINCPTGQPSSRTVAIAARPGIGKVKIAETDGTGFADFTKPQSFTPTPLVDLSIKLLFIQLGVLKVNAYANIDIGNTITTPLSFNNNDITLKIAKNVKSTNFTNSATSSLLGNLSLSASALGLDLGAITNLLTGTVLPALVPVLQLVTTPLDNLLAGLLSSLGIGLGEADVRVTGASCGQSVLVQ